MQHFQSFLFCPVRYPRNFLYSKLKVLELEDVMNMEIEKFMFKFDNSILPDFFNNYFTELDNVHNYRYNITGTIITGTILDKKTRIEFF